MVRPPTPHPPVIHFRVQAESLFEFDEAGAEWFGSEAGVKGAVLREGFAGAVGVDFAEETELAEAAVEPFVGAGLGCGDECAPVVESGVEVAGCLGAFCGEREDARIIGECAGELMGEASGEIEHGAGLIALPEIECGFARHDADSGLARVGAEGVGVEFVCEDGFGEGEESAGVGDARFGGGRCGRPLIGDESEDEPGCGLGERGVLGTDRFDDSDGFLFVASGESDLGAAEGDLAFEVVGLVCGIERGE